MTTFSMHASGAALQKRLDAHHTQLTRKYKSATNASAKVFQKSVKAALPKRKGTLRRHVKIFAIGEHSWKVKVTGTVAHLVMGDVAQHEIDPKGMEAAQSGRARKGRAIMAGPMLAKRALSFPGASHPFPRAIIPAHHGDQTIIPRARAEGSEAARAAAFEVLRT